MNNIIENYFPKQISSLNIKKQIILTASLDYFSKMEILIKSIVALHRKNIDFYVIYSDNKDNSEEKRLINNLNEQLKNFENIKIIGIKNEIPKFLHYVDRIKHGHFNKNVYLRFQIPFLDINSIALYMDVDILCTNLLDDLFLNNMNDANIGMVPELYIKEIHNFYLHEKINSRLPFWYCNGGVILLNMDLIRKSKTNWYEDICNYNLDEFVYHDQCFLNVHYKDKIYFLNHHFNYFVHNFHYELANKILTNKIYSLFLKFKYFFNSQNLILPALFHWNGSLKAWDYNFSIYEMYKNISFEKIASKDELYWYKQCVNLVKRTRLVIGLKSHHLNYKYLYAINNDTNNILKYKVENEIIEIDCKEEFENLNKLRNGKISIYNFPISVLYYHKMGKL